MCTAIIFFPILFRRLKGNFAPNFPLKHAQKDMKFALGLADQLGISLPTTIAANEEYLKVLESKGDEDFCAIHTVDRKK